MKKANHYSIISRKTPMHERIFFADVYLKLYPTITILNKVCDKNVEQNWKFEKYERGCVYGHLPEALILSI